MTKTSTFNIDDIGDPDPVTVTTIQCRRIRVWPVDAQAEYYYRSPVIGSVAVKKSAGEVTIMVPADGQYAFYAGDVAGYLAAVSGTVAMNMEEDY